MMKAIARRMMTLLFCFSLCLCFASTAYAESFIATGTMGSDGDNLTWTLSKTGILTISGDGAMNGVVPYAWYDYDEVVKTVVIEKGVTGISGLSLFKNLMSVSADSENPVFCSLDGVLFSKNMSIIICYPSGRTGDYDIPTNVTSIGESAFESCSGLTSVTIPGNVTSIGASAFADSGLTSVTIPDNVTSIGDHAFYSCSGLTSVTISDNVTSIGESAFESCSGLTSVTIPDKVISIGAWAFADSGLTSVTIPAGMMRINFGAFDGCSSLLDVYYGNTENAWKRIAIGDYNEPLYNATKHYKPAPVDGGAWGNLTWNLDELGTLTISGYGDMDNFSNDPTEAWHRYEMDIQSVVINSGVTSIGNNAFASLIFLTSATIPDSVSHIGDYAFYGCSRLPELEIPSSVRHIGDYAFAGCVGLTDVTIREGVPDIGFASFSYCDNLASVIIPESVTGIGDYAFYRCDSLSWVYYGGTEESWNNIQIGSNNESLADVRIVYYHAADFVLPVSLTTIEAEAFAGGAFTNVELSENCIYIGPNAFANCSNLSCITISNMDTYIDPVAFGDMTELTIYGLTGSTAETFAQTHDFTFIPK